MKKKKEHDKKVTVSNYDEDSDDDDEMDSDDEMEEEETSSNIIPYESYRDRPFKQKADDEPKLKPFLAIPADLLICSQSYHVIYRCNKGQTVRTKFDSIGGLVELHIYSEPLFSSEYTLTLASKLIPKPKKERHLSIIPISFPNDASLGHATRHDYITDIGRLVEIVIPRVKASEFILDAPLSQRLKPKNEGVEDLASESPLNTSNKRKKLEPPKMRLERFTKDTVEVSDIVEIWFEDQQKYFIGTVQEYDDNSAEDWNAVVQWGNHKSEKIYLNIKDCCDCVDNKDRWLFVKKVVS